MKLLLTIISLVWLFFGVALLALVIAYPDMLPAVIPATVPPQAGDVQVPSLWQAYANWVPWFAGIAWVLVFLMPALGLAALASILDTLGRRGIPATTEPARRERAEPVKKRPVTEKVEPTIGDY